MGARSNSLTVRKQERRPKGLQVNQEAKQEQEKTQEIRSFKEAIINILPRDFHTVLQALVTLACLYEFIQTKDAIWLLTAYAMANGSSSLPIMKTLLPTYKESSRKEVEAP